MTTNREQKMADAVQALIEATEEWVNSVRKVTYGKPLTDPLIGESARELVRAFEELEQSRIPDPIMAYMSDTEVRDFEMGDNAYICTDVNTLLGDPGWEVEVTFKRRV